MIRRWLEQRRQQQKYSLEALKRHHTTLLREPEITARNCSLVIETLRAIAELLIWGEQQRDARFFAFFAEHSMLQHFVRLLDQEHVTSAVKTQILQSLSIIVANLQQDVSVYYLLSNNVVNDLIVHRHFDFSDEELLGYFVSFLRTLSCRLNVNTLQFFFNAQANDFPLYSEAIRFFHHPERMVRVAVRTVTLHV